MERTVVFDLAGVICDFEPRLKLDQLAHVTGLSVDAVIRAVWESGLDARADTGEFTAPEYTEHLNKALGVDLHQEVYRKAWAASLILREDVLNCVKSVPCRRAVFSNNGPLLSDVFDNELQPVRDAVDHVVVSWQTGASKPDRRAFDGLGAILQAAPSQMVIVDDSEDNVNGARAAGIDAIHFTDISDLRRQLCLRHIVVNDWPTVTGAIARVDPVNV